MATAQAEAKAHLTSISKATDLSKLRLRIELSSLGSPELELGPAVAVQRELEENVVLGVGLSMSILPGARRPRPRSSGS